MTVSRFSYSGDIEEQDVVEAMKLNQQIPGCFASIGWLIYPAPVD